MAEENNIQKDAELQEFKKTTRHNVNKPLLDVFKDLFKKQAAFPVTSESKHKSTNVNLKTMMSFGKFRTSLVERVGSFFSTLSNIGAPKKEEITNTLKPEIVSSQTKEATSEKTRNDDESVVSQETRYFSGDIAVNQEQKIPSPETIIIAETSLKNELSPDSIDTGTIDVDDNFEKDTDRIEAATINVAPQPNLNKVSNQPNKNIIVPKAPGKTTKNNDNDRSGR